MKETNKKISSSLKVFSFFIGLSLFYFLIIYYYQTFVVTSELFYLSLYKTLSVGQIEKIIEYHSKWKLLSFMLVPISILVRASFTWVCLMSGSFISERFTNVFFWKITIQAELVFALGSLTGLLYTEFFMNLESLEQLSENPFSLQVFISDSVPKWSNYMFNTLNIFELGYILFLSYLLAKESKKKFLPSLKFVASTYLPGLALWLLLVSYLSVVFQP